MSLYDGYKHLLGLPYDDGDRDCYGLCRRYYLDVYGHELPNYARSADFFSDGVDLIDGFLREEGFSVIDVNSMHLQPGDGLLICVPNPQWPSGKVNHVAVFVGNHTFIHHLWQRESCEEYLDAKWERRIMAVLRHPAIESMNAERRARTSVDITQFLPDHVKQKYGIAPVALLEPDSGALRPDPAGRADSGTQERGGRPVQLPEGQQEVD